LLRENSSALVTSGSIPWLRRNAVTLGSSIAFSVRDACLDGEVGGHVGLSEARHVRRKNRKTGFTEAPHLVSPIRRLRKNPALAMQHQQNWPAAGVPVVSPQSG
jgi:hypothetical protein